LHALDIAEFIGNKTICKIFPKGKIRRSCDNLFDTIGPILIDGIEKGENSDVLCQKLKYCTGWE